MGIRQRDKNSSTVRDIIAEFQGIMQWSNTREEFENGCFQTHWQIQ